MNESGLDPDGELLAAAAGGDGEAFATLYQRYLPLVLRWLVRETGDREVAADLAAEVFAASLISAARYHSQGGTVAAWLLGIARNKLRESRRRRKVEESARRRLGMEALPLSDADLERVEELAGLDGMVLGLLDGLPEDQRRALSGRVLDERSYAELAEQLSCSEMVIRKRVSRALSTLRSQVGEQ